MVEADLGRMLDLATPWCLMTAATLRLPQHIAAGHHDVTDLAEVASCDPDALHALLGYLVAQGVFVQDAPGRFSCNRAAERLAEPGGFLDLEGIGGRMAHTWPTVLEYVRTGQPAYQRVFGRPFWEDLAAHPKVAADFDALMGPAGHGVPDADIEFTTGWDAIESVVDVGGGTGSMLAALLKRHPKLRGTLVDLPGTVARAADTIREVEDRVTISGQSFFDPLPVGADLYLLKKVLNDWPDDPTVAILRNCCQAAPRNGTVVIIGGVSPDETTPVLAIDMLVAGGKTTPLSRFTELAAQAGLDVAAASTQSAGYVVECTPREKVKA